MAVFFGAKVLDPQHKEELHGYLQIVDDEVTPEENVNEDNQQEEGEEESLSGSSDEGSNSEVESDMECEIDEEFRKEIKMVLGDAALPSSEV